MVKDLITQLAETRPRLESALKRLDKQYDYCVSHVSDQSFFSGIIEYFNIIATNSGLVALVEANIMPEKELYRKAMNDAAVAYRNVLTEGWEKVCVYIDKHEPDNKPLALLRDEVEKHLDGRTMMIEGDENEPRYRRRLPKDK